MKCSICGTHTLPGAKLCGPCRAALKRARDDSVWEVPSGRPSGPARGAPDDAEAPASWVLGTRGGLNWRVWAIGAACVGVVAVGLWQWTSSGDAVGSATEPSARPSSAAAEPVRAQPVLRDVVPTALPVSAPDGASAAPRATPAQEEPHSLPRDRGHLVLPPKAKPSPEPQPLPAAAPVDAPPPAPVEPVRAAAPPPPPPARPVDPWQRMNEALAQCQGQDLLARLGCEHRVRGTYCSGHWGEVAQCPGGVTNDHGQ